MNNTIKIIAKPKIGTTNSRNTILYKYVESEEGFNLKFSVEDFSVLNFFKGHFDIVHIHWPDRVLIGSILVLPIRISLFFFFLLFAKVIKRAKIVYTVHNPIPKTSVPEFYRSLYYGILRSAIDGYIYPSKQTESIFKSLAAPSIDRAARVIPLGIQDELVGFGAYAPRELLEVMKHKYLLFVGRVSPDKKFHEGILEIIETARFQDFKILVAGIDQDKDQVSHLKELSTQYPDRVFLLFRELLDSEINALIISSEAVVINYPAINSGIATLAIANKTSLIIFDKEYRNSLRDTYQYQSVYSLENFKSEPHKSEPYCKDGLREVAKKTSLFYKEVLGL